MWQPSGSRKTEQCAVLRSAAMASYVPKSVTNLCPSGAQVANTTGISYFKPEEAAPQEPGKFGSKNTRIAGMGQLITSLRSPCD